MIKPVIEIVGSSAVWHEYEKRNNICSECSGNGELALTNRAAYTPEQYPAELMKCPACDGTGKRTQEGDASD